MHLDKKRILISGSTGILGKATINYLVGEEDFNEITIIVRKESKIPKNLASNCQLFNSQDFLDFQFTQSSPDVYIPLDFLTMEKLISLDKEIYKLTNVGLIDRQAEIIKKARPRSVLLISSGAVNYESQSDSLNKEHLKVYGELKLLQESVLHNACKLVGANLIVLRLWNCSGVGIAKKEVLGLSEFIYKAMRNETIQIKSSGPTWSRFVYYPEALKLCLSLCEEGEDISFDSGGHLTSMLGLASCVINTLNSKSDLVLPSEYCQVNVNNYFSLSDQYEFQLSRRFGGILAKDLKEQVELTAKLTN